MPERRTRWPRLGRARPKAKSVILEKREEGKAKNRRSEEKKKGMEMEMATHVPVFKASCLVFAFLGIFGARNESGRILLFHC